MCFNLFFFNDTTTTEIYTLSLHDALPILRSRRVGSLLGPSCCSVTTTRTVLDRKSTRLNSSHANISYAVFCLKKKTHSAPAGHARRVAYPAGGAGPPRTLRHAM